MKRICLSFLFLVSVTVLTSCTGNRSTGNTGPDQDVILINQVGYEPDAAKVALIRSNDTKFRVVNSETGKTVLRGITGEPSYWEYSGDTVRKADFSSLTEPGVYKICLGGNICSYDFRIGKNVYTEANKIGMKSFYLNRSGIDITEEYGGKWARTGGHPDTAVLIHESAASAKRPAGTVISSPGGWYDAGDYNKYIVNSSISVYTMMLACQLFPEYCDSLSLDIPEGNNDLPDVIDEILFNLKWMLTMQDPNDGGVYHKLTNKEFGGFEMPDMATTPRYMVMKSTAATLDFAATMAMTSRVLSRYAQEELKSLASTCIEAAHKAMKWAYANPAVIYVQPSDIKTGEYGGRDLDDEWFWAKTELAITDNDPSNTDPAAIMMRKPEIQSWGAVDMLGIISLTLTADPAFAEARKAATEVLLRHADELLRKSQSSAFMISLDFWKWGSNSDVVNQAMLKIIAAKITGEKKYFASAQDDLDYILGRNATGYCFITGIGSKPPMNIHHRPSGADGVAEPFPGFLVGGPNIVVPFDCKGTDVVRSTFPAKSYADALCSYSTNEICINWNSPLFFVLTAMDNE